MQNPVNSVLDSFDTFVEKKAYKAVMKYGEVPISAGETRRSQGHASPPYERQFDPTWIYRIRKNSALVNNAIEELVNQTFRRGWDEWEEAWVAKCPECEEEFESEEAFVEDFHPDDPEIDLESERECPECERMVDFQTPERALRQYADDFFGQVNARPDPDAPSLEPDGHGSVSQTLMEVLRELGRDIGSFDDAWMMIERRYALDEEGRVLDYDPTGVHRAPPERMRYVVDEDTGRFGGEYWVCLDCRRHENYEVETDDQRCTECGKRTYEVYAVTLDGPVAGDPIKYHVRGEFVHRSMFAPSRLYGWPPILSLWEETRTLEQMDSWYQDAYEHRRAPRAAISIKTGNSESVRSFNKKQFEKMKADPNHIPTLQDDSETDGDPIKLVNLLESPAEMQHMEMREWFLDRISAKYGVTAVFQKASPGDSGMSQSMEIQVSNRASDRIRTVLQQFVDALLAQLGADGWEREIAGVEEEDEHAEAELMQKHLQAASQAEQMGLEVEWTEDDRAEIAAGEVDVEEMEGMGPGGGMGGPGEGMGVMGEGGNDAQDEASERYGSDEVQEDRPSAPDTDANTSGQSPPTPDMPGERNSPQKMLKDLDGGVEVYNAYSEDYEPVKVKQDKGEWLTVETVDGKEFDIRKDDTEPLEA